MRDRTPGGWAYLLVLVLLGGGCASSNHDEAIRVRVQRSEGARADCFRVKARGQDGTQRVTGVLPFPDEGPAIVAIYPGEGLSGSVELTAEGLIAGERCDASSAVNLSEAASARFHEGAVVEATITLPAPSPDDDADGDGVRREVDCDDGDPLAFPGLKRSETACADGRDEDCRGGADCADAACANRSCLGDVCAIEQTCVDFVCAGGRPLDCDSDVPCRVAGTGGCEGGGCTNMLAAEGTPCEGGTCDALGTCQPLGGCEGGACDGGFFYSPRHLDPAAIPAEAIYPARVIDCPVTVNTTSGVVDLCGAETPAASRVGSTTDGGYSLLAVRGLTIAASGTLRAEGDLPLVLVVFGDAEIAGAMEVDATEMGGAGSDIGCPAQSALAGGGMNGGGAGGSGALAGGAGGLGSSGDGAMAGLARGELTARPQGGCAGGRGASDHPTQFALGGAAGGMIQLSVAGRLEVSGRVSANGAGGAGGPVRNGGTGGAGGGSGGGVLLEAQDLAFTPSAVLAANGGAGGGGGLGGATAAAGAPGEAGRAGAARAEGGGGGSAVAGGSGGRGGALEGPAESGEDEAALGAMGGGGGGGGAGSITVRAAGACTRAAGSVVSPAWTSAGSVACP